MDFVESTSESHTAASQFMIDHADKLVAVWDGRAGTRLRRHRRHRAYAREVGTPTTVIWPPGVTRD